MANNAILYCGLTPSAYRGKTTVDLPVYCFRIFDGNIFVIIRQNVNMATNAILYCGLTPSAYRGKKTVDLPVYCFRIVDGHVFL